MGSSLNKEYLEASSCRKDVFRAGSRFARFVNFGEMGVLFSFGASHSWRITSDRAAYTVSSSIQPRQRHQYNRQQHWHGRPKPNNNRTFLDATNDVVQNKVILNFGYLILVTIALLGPELTVEY